MPQGVEVELPLGQRQDLGRKAGIQRPEYPMRTKHRPELPLQATIETRRAIGSERREPLFEVGRKAVAIRGQIPLDGGNHLNGCFAIPQLQDNHRSTTKKDLEHGRKNRKAESGDPISGRLEGRTPIAALAGE